MKRTLVAAALTLVLSGCWQYDHHSTMLLGNYNICWIDSERLQTIMHDPNGKGGGVYETDPYIFAVGHNDRYIIAKQHPLCNDYSNESCMPDQSITNYFIIDGPARTTFGPLTENQFSDKKKELGIEALAFDQLFPEVPQN